MSTSDKSPSVGRVVMSIASQLRLGAKKKRWIQGIHFHTNFPKQLKHIGLDENVYFQIDVMIIAKTLALKKVLNMECLCVLSFSYIDLSSQ